MSDFADAESRAEWDAAFRKQAALFDTDDRKHYQRSTLELADPSANSVGASHFKDGDETEAAAARLVKPGTGSLRSRVLNLIAYQKDRGATAHETAHYLRALLYSVMPRLTELRDAGWIEDSQQRRATPSGAKGIVWVLTPRGREAWNRMEGERT